MNQALIFSTISGSINILLVLYYIWLTLKIMWPLQNKVEHMGRTMNEQSAVLSSCVHTIDGSEKQMAILYKVLKQKQDVFNESL